MWKAFAEMEALGWIGSHRPRMVAAQSEGCAPVVKAFHDGLDPADPGENASTLAGGLRVPVVIGGEQMLTALRESDGTAVAVPDSQILQAQQMLAVQEGMFVCLEAAATIAALRQLVTDNWIKPDEKVLVFNTGSGLKYRMLLT
jgi:threonine synthase